jgi:hypothetical protein
MRAPHVHMKTAVVTASGLGRGEHCEGLNTHADAHTNYRVGKVKEIGDEHEIGM